MPSKESRVELLQGTLDLIVLRALSTMGPQHAYGLRQGITTEFLGIDGMSYAPLSGDNYRTYRHWLGGLLGWLALAGCIGGRSLNGRKSSQRVGSFAAAVSSATAAWSLRFFAAVVAIDRTDPKTPLLRIEAHDPLGTTHALLILDQHAHAVALREDLPVVRVLTVDQPRGQQEIGPAHQQESVADAEHVRDPDLDDLHAP